MPLNVSLELGAEYTKVENRLQKFNFNTHGGGTVEFQTINADKRKKNQFNSTSDGRERHRRNGICAPQAKGFG